MRVILYFSRFLLYLISLFWLFLPDYSFVQMSRDSTVAEIPAKREVQSTTVSSPTVQRPDDVGTTLGMTSGVPTTDIDSELSCPGSEPLQTDTPAEKPTPQITYDTVEGELRTSTSETEEQETSDDGRTITRRIKTSRYYQPVIHRTLADGVVVNETSEDVLVGSYVDEYCFDAPLDVVDVYSASVETQTSVDETEQTLEDGTWLRRKITSVVAYLAVDEDETENIREAKPKLATEVSDNPPDESKRSDPPDHKTEVDTELQRSTTDGGLESKEFPAVAVEPAREQAVLESVIKPVDTVSQPDGEPEQHAQVESGSIPVPTTEVSADCSDLTRKVEPSSTVIEVESEYEAEHAVVVLREEQITTKTMKPDHKAEVDTELQRSTTDGGLESKEYPTGAVEPAGEQAVLESVVKPVDTVSQPDEELEQHAQVESGSIPVRTTEMSADCFDLTRNVEPSSTVTEVELEYEAEHAVVVSREEQITTKAMEPSDSFTTATTEPKDVSVPSTESPELVPFSQPGVEAEQHAQVESGSIPVRTTEMSADCSDLTRKVEPSSVVIEAELEYEAEHAVIVSREEQITTKAMEPSESFTTAEPKDVSVSSTECPEELHAVVVSREEQVTTKAMEPSESSTTAEPKDVSVPSTESPEDLMPVTEWLIIAVPNPRARPTMTSVPVTSSFDEPEEFPEGEHMIEAEQSVEQFAASPCDLEPVSEETITPTLKVSARDTVKLDSRSEETVSAPGSMHESKKVEPREDAVPQSTVVTSTDDVATKETSDSTTGAGDLTKNVTQTLEQTLTDKKPEALSKSELVECTEDKMMIAPESQFPHELQDVSDLVQPDTAPVTEELIVAVPNPRQERSRPVVASVPMTSSFDEPEELIEECHTAEQFATPACDSKPVEENVIIRDIRPPRDTSLDTITLDSEISVPGTADRTPFVPVEKSKASTSEAVQLEPSATDFKAAATADQQRTRPVLVLKSDTDVKPGPTAPSTFVPTLPPLSSSRQPRRPRSANEMTTRRYGIESPQPGIYSKPRVRRESPLSFVDRFAYPASPTPLGMEDFDNLLFDDGRRQVRTRSKKLITRKVRKVRHDGEVVEDIVTEEVPDYGYSDTSSVRSGQSPATMSPRTPSVSSLTSPLPVEPLSPGADSLSSQSSLRVFTDTIEGEPEVVTDVQEREETLPDGRVVIRKIIRTRQKQTIVKRTVMEGPSADDEQATEDSGQLVVAGEDLQKPDIRTYSDAMDMRPSTETVSNDVEEVLPDGTVRRKLTTTTSTRQLKTERTVVEGPYAPETVNQALQGDVLRPSESAMLPQSASSSSSTSRPASTTTKTSGPSRTSARPKFRISMESPPPPPVTAENEGAAAGKITDPSHPAGHPFPQQDQSSQPT